MTIRLSVILTIFVLGSSGYAASAFEKAITNFALLRVGCYQFTDKLEYSSAHETFYAEPVLTNSPPPDSFRGKSAKIVDCKELHHLEVRSIKVSGSKSSTRLDSIPLKSNCIIGNIKMMNAGHNLHAVQTYFDIFRISQNKLNKSFCGVIAPSFPNPENPNYRIYQAFTSPHLKGIQG